MSNVDSAEIGKFDALAHRWWDPEGDFRPLHDINPARLGFILDHADLLAGEVVDVGCGGGILTESMARTGATATGIDLAPSPLAVARLHAIENGVDVNYLETSPEQLAAERPGAFRTVTCLEMIEHVPDYGSVVQACADLCAPGGDLFFSTINRTPKAYVMAVLGAEYVMNLLPRGTHRWRQFVRPTELDAMLTDQGFAVIDRCGVVVNPFNRRFRTSPSTTVNYMLAARKLNRPGARDRQG